MKDIQKQNKIHSILANNQLDALLLGNVYNVQYATGVDIACAHAQPDLLMFALYINGQEPVLLVPHCWEGSAIQTSDGVNVISYGIDKTPLDAAMAIITELCQSAKRVGVDDNAISVALGLRLAETLSRLGSIQISCGHLMRQARAIKTEQEIELLTEIAYKADHVINGHFHHLSADRPRTASLMSESLRVHSSERDIPIAGYNACARATLGEAMSHFWAYAPKFGFAEAEMTQDRDAIIADVMTCESGYWSNATRIGITFDEMSEDQEIAYAQLNRLRELLLNGLKIGRKCSEIYQEIVTIAKKENLSLILNLPLGFSIGVSPQEGPYLSSGETQKIEEHMVLVLDPVVQHKGLFYRSRDTVVVTADGADIVNWYKDWREPYLAILEL